MLFTPDEHTALAGWSWTRNHLILTTRADVSSRMELLTPGPGPDGWRRAPLAGVPPLSTASVTCTDPDVSDEYFLNVSGYLQPSTLYRGTAGGDAGESVKRGPALFDTAGLAVRQHFAVSADGTRVPYFVVGPEDRPGPGPTLMYGYGGFEISMVPQYSAVTGRAWLARGGTYVVAGIRGGREYGPGWHRAALGANRVRAFEDFAAVARDLTARGITTPAQLGIEGGSNGGLLMGAMLTRDPELFGAVVAHVPLMDMLRFHRLLAGASWTAEYGDPENPADRPHLEGISPTTGSAPRVLRTRPCCCSPRPATTASTPGTPARWPPGCASSGTPSSSTSTWAAATPGPPTTSRRRSTRRSCTPSCGSG